MTQSGTPKSAGPAPVNFAGVIKHAESVETDESEHNLSRLLLDLYYEDDTLVMEFDGADFRRLSDDRLDAVELPLRKSDAFHFMSHALEVWRHHHNPKTFTKQLKVMVKKGRHGVGPDTFKSLKRQRKNAAIIRSLFMIYDKKHKAPRKFRKFVKGFGKLNDAIAAGAGIKPAAKALRKRYDPDLLWKTTRKFRPGPQESTRTFLNHSAHTIIAKLHQSALTAEEFHDLRKTLKHFKNVIGLSSSSAAEPPPAFTKMEAYFEELNDAMGAINDVMVSLDFKREIDPKNVKIRLVDEMRFGVAQAVGLIML